jgi:hypothetical protein
MIHYMPDVIKAMNEAVASNPDLQEKQIDNFVLLVNPYNEALMEKYEQGGRILIEIKMFGDRPIAVFL